MTLEKNNKGKHSKYLPFVFTEQGISMLSSVLRSDLAIEINISIMRVFIKLRQFALSNAELIGKLDALKNKYDKQENVQKERKQIGYK